MRPSAHEHIIAVLKERAAKFDTVLRMPPPAFLTMQGEFVAFDAAAGHLTVQFPVLEGFLNPFRTMQGGFLAAAVDNTIGPLSMLLAPPSVTHRLEMKFSRAVTEDLGYILVEACLMEHRKRRLTLEALVRDPQGQLLATGKATNWTLTPTE